jgi:hypothetical protein
MKWQADPKETSGGSSSSLPTWRAVRVRSRRGVVVVGARVRRDCHWADCTSTDPDAWTMMRVHVEGTRVRPGRSLSQEQSVRLIQPHLQAAMPPRAYSHIVRRTPALDSARARAHVRCAHSVVDTVRPSMSAADGMEM